MRQMQKPSLWSTLLQSWVTLSPKNEDRRDPLCSIIVLIYFVIGNMNPWLDNSFCGQEMKQDQWQEGLPVYLTDRFREACWRLRLNAEIPEGTG